MCMDLYLFNYKLIFLFSICTVDVLNGITHCVMCNRPISVIYGLYVLLASCLSVIIDNNKTLPY